MENPTNPKGLMISIAVIALILIGGTYFLSHRTAKVVEETPTQDAGLLPVTIDMKHQFANGTHTVAGSIDLPTSCYSLNTAASVDESRNVATLAFTSTTSSEVCAQVVTSKDFKTTFKGKADAHIEATWNGKAVNINVFEVPTGENIDTYIISVKG